MCPICVNFNYEGIVTDGLLVNIDAGFTTSYPRSGNPIYDLSGNGNDGEINNCEIVGYSTEDYKVIER